MISMFCLGPLAPVALCFPSMIQNLLWTGHSHRSWSQRFFEEDLLKKGKLAMSEFLQTRKLYWHITFGELPLRNQPFNSEKQ